MSLVDGQWLLFGALWRKYGNPPVRFQRVIEDHRGLITAIERRDASGAAMLMGAHVEKAKQDVLARVALSEGGSAADLSQAPRAVAPGFASAAQRKPMWPVEVSSSLALRAALR